MRLFWKKFEMIILIKFFEVETKEISVNFEEIPKKTLRLF